MFPTIPHIFPQPQFPFFCNNKYRRICQICNWKIYCPDYNDLVVQVLDKMDEEEIAKMDADEIMARQVEELEKEKKELQVYILYLPVL